MSKSALALSLLSWTILTPSAASAGEEDAPASSAAPSGAPPPSTTTVQAETSLASTYVFRGIPQYASRRVASSQSTVALTMPRVGPGDLALTAWNATALAAPGPQRATSLELDLTAAYGKRIGPVDASAGYIAYVFPRAAVVDGAHEVFATAALADLFLTPSIGVYAELVRLHGAYAVGALGKKLTSGHWSFIPQASVGFAGYRDARAHVNDITANAGVEWAFAEPFYVAARGSVSFLPMPRDLMPEGDRTVASRFVPSVSTAIGILSP